MEPSDNLHAVAALTLERETQLVKEKWGQHEQKQTEFLLSAEFRVYRYFKFIPVSSGNIASLTLQPLTLRDGDLGGNQLRQ